MTTLSQVNAAVKNAAVKIDPVPEEIHRPLWSVMIPTFNCANYLRQTLESVLAQDPGPEMMQIEVVDDCSTKDEPEAVVSEIGQGRVVFYRKPQNEGATANFNTCIQRSRGQLVHILHGDDYVLPGFYDRVGQAAHANPQLALFTPRVFIVDEAGVIDKVSERLEELEQGGTDVHGFYYHTPIQTAGVVIRRSFYEKSGGFRADLVHTADVEMWSRAIHEGGGMVFADVLACYRIFAQNDTARLKRTAGNLRDIQRLNAIFAGRYADFDASYASSRLCSIALAQAKRFKELNDREAIAANLDFWAKNASPKLKIQEGIKRFGKQLVSSR